MSMASRIATQRAAYGLSLQQLADLAGCTKTHVWDMERGRADNPSLAILLGLSRALGCSVGFLAGVHDFQPDYHPEALDVARKLDAILRSTPTCTTPISRKAVAS